MNKKKIVFYFSLFLFSVILDRITKLLVIHSLFYKKLPLSKFLDLNLAINRGVSFGLFHFKSFIPFIILSSVIFLIIAAFAVYTFYRFKKNKNIFFEILVLAGALSNFVDRFLYGGVIDFIDFYVANWHWPTFNFADVFVFVGIVGMFIRNLYDDA